MNTASRFVPLALCVGLVTSLGYANAASLLWTGKTAGANDAAWTTAAANTNWKDTVTGLASDFTNNDDVEFDDNAAGPLGVQIQAAGVQPRVATFSNKTKDYDLSGGPVAGAAAIHKTNTGLLTLSSKNTYTGDTELFGGAIAIGDNGAFGTGRLLIYDGTILGVGAARTVANAITYDALIGGTSTIFGIQDLTFTGDVTLSGANTVTVSNTGLTTFSGVIKDAQGNPGSFTKDGVRTLVFSGANTYSGGTTIDRGTLRVSNAAGSGTGTGAVDVNGGVLAGKGNIAGKVTVNGGADIRPGGSAGTLTINGGLDLSGGGTYGWELAVNTVAGPGTNFDTISLPNGALALGDSAALSVEFIDSATAPTTGDAFWRSPHAWKIIDVANPSQNAGTDFGRLLHNVYPAGTFSTVVGTGADAGDILLQFTPSQSVPALSGWAAVALAGLMAGAGGFVLLNSRKESNSRA